MERISRRDFIKDCLIGGAALAVPRRAEAGSYIETIKTIETPNAAYYPFYERHDIHPDLVKALENVPRKPDIHFYEISLFEPAKEFLLADSGSLLEMNTGNASMNKDFGRLIPDSTLEFFAKNRINVSFEGVRLGPEYVFRAGVLKESETLMGIIAAETTVLKRLWNQAKKMPYSRRAFLTDVALFIPAIWLGGPKVSSTLAVNLESRGKERVSQALFRINASLSHLHPENMIIFFRNLIMARKLQFLAEGLREEGVAKPVISFSAGFAHMGINDFLTLGSEFTLKVFNIYPAGTLKNVIEGNGGIDAFCTTQVISPSDGTKKILYDHKLGESLREKLG